MEALIRSITPSSPLSSSRDGRLPTSPCKLSPGKGEHISPPSGGPLKHDGKGGIRGWGMREENNKEEEEEEADRSLQAVKCSQLECIAYGLTLSSLMQCSQLRG